MPGEQELLRQSSPDGDYSVEDERAVVRVLFVTASGDETGLPTALGNRRQFAVQTANANEGLDRLEAGEFDCVVSEYRLADGDGLSVLSEVRAEFPTLPFVLVSDETVEGLADEALSAGATDYVQSSPDDSSALLSHRILSELDRREDEQVADDPLQDEFHRIYRALETAQEGIALVDDDGEFIYVNQAYADLHNSDSSEMLGKSWMHKYADHEVDRVQENVLPDLYDEGTWSGKTEGRRQDGSTFLENHSLSTTADGGLVCTIRDITEQEKRKELVEYYRSVVEDVFGESEVGVFILDSSLDVAWTNQSVERYFGLNGTTVEGWNMTEVVEERLERRVAEPEALQEELIDADEAAETEGSEVHVVSGENRPERYLQRRSQPIESGEYAGGRLELYYDITERKKREEKLEQFADVLSHDLRNPLGIAQIYVEQAQDGGGEESFAEVEQALDRMETIIQNVLTMARASRDCDDRTRTRLETVADRAWGQTETADASLHVEDHDGAISADEDRLQSVFENLFRNAVEHGGDDVSVRIGTLDESSRTTASGKDRREDQANGDSTDGSVNGFYVEDDGAGIPAENRENVLEYGYSDDGGTGFGLAIVQEIIDAHGWELNTTESSDGGARFEIRGVEPTN